MKLPEAIGGTMPDFTREAAAGGRVAGVDDVQVVGAEDVGEAGSVQVPAGRAEQQLATLAVRFEMAAVYLRLAGG